MPGSAEIHGTLGKKGAGVNTERRTYMLPAWLAFVIWAFVVGGICGWMARMHTVHDQYLTTMALRYQAEKAWLEARTAEMLAEVERYATDVKRQLKTKRAALR
jgi:hypothetical protein